MAVTITRTSWTDDDGTGTSGTVINNAVKTELYGQIDTALALVLPLAGGTMTGDLKFTDATYDIGKSAATRPRHYYGSGNVTVGGSLILLGWNDVAYNAGDYTGSAGTWTVDSGDVISFRYTVLNSKTIAVEWFIQTTTVASGGAELRIAIPGGYTGSGRSIGAATCVDNNTGATVTPGFVQVLNGGTTIKIQRDFLGSTWSNATNNTAVIGAIVISVA